MRCCNAGKSVLQTHPQSKQANTPHIKRDEQSRPESRAGGKVCRASGACKPHQATQKQVQGVSMQKARKKTVTNPKTGRKRTVRYGQKGANVALCCKRPQLTAALEPQKMEVQR
jgi:hypothetical protein